MTEDNLENISWNEWVFSVSKNDFAKQTQQII